MILFFFIQQKPTSQWINIENYCANQQKLMKMKINISSPSAGERADERGLDVQYLSFFFATVFRRIFHSKLSTWYIFYALSNHTLAQHTHLFERSIKSVESCRSCMNWNWGAAEGGEGGNMIDDSQLCMSVFIREKWITVCDQGGGGGMSRKTAPSCPWWRWRWWWKTYCDFYQCGVDFKVMILNSQYFQVNVWVLGRE